MLDRVIQYQKRMDATARMKFLAISAFQETVSFRLPWDVAGILIERGQSCVRYVSPDTEMKNLIEQRSSSVIELYEIISLMFALNRKFNGVMCCTAALRHFVAFCRKAKFSAGNKGKQECLDDVFITLKAAR
jgi:hypothetical protein